MKAHSEFIRVRVGTVLTLMLLLTISGSQGQVDDDAVRRVFGGPEGASQPYVADESNLADSTYRLDDKTHTAEARVNWYNGMILFSATALSSNLTDIEGLRMEARDHAYIKAREFLGGIIAGRTGSYERIETELIDGGMPTSKAAERRKSVISIEVPSALIRGIEIKDEGVDYIPHPVKRNEKMMRARATISLLLYNKEYPEQAILPDLLDQIREAEKSVGVVLVAHEPTATPSESQSKRPAPGAISIPPSPKVPSVTGLVVDTRGLHMRPVAAPAIFIREAANRQVFGALKVDHEYVARLGIAGWSRSLDEALAMDDRVGANPMLVKADGLLPERPGAALIVKADAAEVLAADADSGFLSECRVIFVVD